MAGRPRTFDKDEVLGAVTALFWEKGYEATGLAEILERSGVARQSLYNTFGDKKQLYLACLSFYCERYLAMVQEHLSRDLGAYENLCDLVFSMSDTSGEMARLGDMLTNAMVEFGGKDEEVNKITESTVAKLEAFVKTAIEYSVAEGDLPARVIPRRVALDVVNSVFGMQFMRRAGRDSSDIREVAEATIEGIAYLG